MTKKRGGPASPSSDDPAFVAPPFDTVDTRARHDGWSSERQRGFIEALGECGCVDEASQRVGMSARSAYALRRRIDAQSFRQAWDFALDYAIRRLSDGAFSRAINGVSRPVFYKGEQIGERRHYDERLTMFLLRYRDPVRYGAWLDGMQYRRHPDGAAIALSKMADRVEDDAEAEQAGVPKTRHPPLYAIDIVSEAVAEAQRERADDARIAADEAYEDARDKARREAGWNAYLATQAKAEAQRRPSGEAASGEAASGEAASGEADSDGDVA